MLFSPDSVRAILGGRKTQTRRLHRGGDAIPRCKFGQAGDLLWVRENFAMDADESVHYRADYPEILIEAGYTWRPSIYMPKTLARIWLQIVRVKFERLQDISEHDLVAEGLPDNWLREGRMAQQWFVGLWDRLHAYAPYRWVDNPAVWAIEFEVLTTTGEIRL